MSVKIRLQRRGRTHYSRFSIVVADTRAPRDGRIIEKLGTYNPNTNPANINLEFDRAIHWLQVGAIPSDTCRSILTHEGVMYKNHLINGVKKGALTEEQVEERFNTWKKEKEAKIDKVLTNIETKAKDKADKLFEAEKLINEERAAELAKRNSALLEEDATGFDTASHDFEMLVLEDGHETDSAVTPYYFWVELE